MKVFASRSLFFIAAVGIASVTHAQTMLTGCAAKMQEVQTKLDQARAHGNKIQEAKLKIAQKQLENSCTDEGLRREREADVKKKEAKVAARKAALEKAKARGKTKKIAQQEQKLHDAEAELQTARARLAQ